MKSYNHMTAPPMRYGGGLHSSLTLIGKSVSQIVRHLSPDIQKLVEAPDKQIRLSDTQNHLRAVERRRTLDGLAALTLLLRLSLESGSQLLTKEYAASPPPLNVLLMLGNYLIGQGVADRLFALYVERLLRHVCWDGMRNDLGDYPFS